MSTENALNRANDRKITYIGFLASIIVALISGFVSFYLATNNNASAINKEYEIQKIKTLISATTEVMEFVDSGSDYFSLVIWSAENDKDAKKDENFGTYREKIRVSHKLLLSAIAKVVLVGNTEMKDALWDLKLNVNRFTNKADTMSSEEVYALRDLIDDAIDRYLVIAAKTYQERPNK